MIRKQMFLRSASVAVLALGLSVTTALGQEAPAKNYAQALIDRALAQHPEVLTLAMHVTPPNSADNIIIASNFGRIGKKADADDLGVINTGKPLVEMGKSGDRLSVELPLRDVSGDTIGALAIAFRYKAGEDRGEFLKKAERIRDEISRRITNAGNLVEPFPYSDVPTNTYAQRLVDETMASHPELQILALHVKPPGGTENVIIASSIGRIGKKADEDDVKVIQTGEPILEVHISGKRFEVELQLHDASGRTIGAMSAVYAYKPGDDKQRFRKRAEALRAEMEKKIPSVASLVAAQ